MTRLCSFRSSGPLVARTGRRSARCCALAAALCSIFALDPKPADALIQIGEMNFPSWVSGIAVVDGDVAYVIRRDGALHAIDTSDPSAPSELGSIETAGYFVDIEVAGGFAFVADGASALWVFDVSDPAHLVEVGTFPVEALNYLREIKVSDQILYACGGGGLAMIDVSDSAAPTEIGHFYVSWCEDVEVVRGIAYLATGLHTENTIVDVSNPAAPFELGAMIGPISPAYKVSIIGDVAYLSSKYALHTFDVSNPAAPIALDPFESLKGDVVQSSGGRAYLIDMPDIRGGLRYLDVSNPANPRVVSALNLSFPLFGGAIGNGVAYLTSFASLRIVDLSHPEVPAVIGALDLPGHAIEIADDIAYVLGLYRDRSLHLIDVSDPTAPVEMGAIGLRGSSVSNRDRPLRDLSVVGDFAYVTFEDQLRLPAVSGLIVVDISNPSAPVEVGSWTGGGGSALSVEVSDGAAFVSGGAGLKMLDVSDPTAPIEIGMLVLDSERVNDYHVDDGVAFVAQRVSGSSSAPTRFVAYDVANPRAPIEIDAFEFPGVIQFKNFTVSGNLVYASIRGPDPHWSTRLRVLDIADLGAIREITGSDTGLPLVGGQIVIADSLALVRLFYLGRGELEVMIFDVSDPLAPQYMGTLVSSTPRSLQYGEIAVSAGSIFSTGELGLEVFDLGPEYGLRAPANALQCYRARAPGRIQLLGDSQLNLSDSFGERTDRVGRIREFCTPAGVDRLGIADAEAHLACRDLIGTGLASISRSRRGASGTQRGWVPFEVVVDNAFGDGQTLAVEQPERFCAAASAETRDSGAAPADPSALMLDHFQCYGVGTPADLPRFDSFEVSVADFFGDATRQVVEPLQLCTPVDVDGEGVIDPTRYWTCYGVDDLDRRLRRQRTRMLMGDRFGEEQAMTVRAAKTLCIPSEIRAP